MDWFKKNTFLGVLAIFTAAAAAAAVYFALSASSELTARQAEYAANTGAVSRIQEAKPFPDQANATLAEQEAERAGQLIDQIFGIIKEQTAPLEPALTPQGFQDRASSAAAALEEAARQNGVSLPADFYLGFEQYRSEPPPAGAAPLLGQQLQNINNVLSLLIDARVASINSVVRPTLDSEKQPEGPGDNAGSGSADSLVLAPFDVEFTADHSNFREALGAVIEAEPLVLVRLLSVANSQPVGPDKEGGDPAADGGGATAEKPSGIPVMFGQETVTVRMRLAAVSGIPGGLKN